MRKLRTKWNAAELKKMSSQRLVAAESRLLESRKSETQHAKTLKTIDKVLAGRGI